MSVLRFRKARGCVLTSNSVTSSDWLIGSRFFFPEAVRIEASIAREDWAECGWFQMLLTDGFLPSAMKPHMIKVLPASKEPQGMDGVGWPQNDGCWAWVDPQSFITLLYPLLCLLKIVQNKKNGTKIL